MRGEYGSSPLWPLGVGGAEANSTDECGPGLGKETRPINAYLHYVIRIA
jgi:hypothetical protein